MFFDDLALTLKKKVSIKVPPPVPDTNWRAPTSFPNLDGAEAIGFDVETKETDFAHGPGWSRGRGHIVGISLAAIDRYNNRGQWYFPVRHEVGAEQNLDPTNVFSFVRHVLGNPQTHKVGTNVMYDMGWLGEEAIAVKGPLHDVQFAQALIDEQSPTALEWLAQTYLGEGKITNALYDWCRLAYGGNADDQRANIYRAPPSLVGPYAEGDAIKPLDILSKQWPIIQAEELSELYQMEHELIPLLLQIRRNGVRIDVNRAERLLSQFQTDALVLRGKLALDCGFQLNPNSPKDCARAFDQFNIPYEKTDDGNPSFPKEFLDEIEHPIGKAINEIRAIEKVSGTFLRNYLLEGHVNGRIHCQFHPLRTASSAKSSGAKTGRFASSDPNLQNIPVRTKAGKQVRTCFIPDEAESDWFKNDYSQIEYRMLAHFAVDNGDGSSERLRQTYRDNPKTDYHDNVFVAFCELTGLDFANMSKQEKSDRRKPIKNINFGLLYGQSAKSLAFKAGMSPADAKKFFEGYHKAAPYVKPTMEAVTDEVNAHGFVRTIANRRTRFKLWQNSKDHKSIALPYDAAIRQYGYSITRAWAYRGTNYKFQGSAADIIKRAMRQAYKDGIFDVIGYPKLQVHDELDFSRFDKHNPKMIEAYKHLTHVLENSTPCNVPIIVSTSEGKDWGSCD